MSAAAVVIIRIKPPRLAAMDGNQWFCDELNRAGQIGAFWANSQESEPENLEAKLNAIVDAMCGNSAIALATASDELWPLPS